MYIMDNYDKIKELINYGYRVKCKRDDWEIDIFSGMYEWELIMDLSSVTYDRDAIKKRKYVSIEPIINSTYYKPWVQVEIIWKGKDKVRTIYEHDFNTCKVESPSTGIVQVDPRRVIPHFKEKEINKNNYEWMSIPYITKRHWENYIITNWYLDSDYRWSDIRQLDPNTILLDKNFNQVFVKDVYIPKK